MNPKELPSVRMLEGIESSAWSDYFRAGELTVGDISGVTVLCAPRFPSPDVNRAIGLGSIVPATEELLHRTIASFPEGIPFYLQVVPNADPPELHQWIRDRGFTPQRRWVKLYQHLPPGNGTPGTANPEIRIEEARSGDALVLGRTICSGFGFPPELAPWLGSLAGRKGWRGYLAYLHDAIAGAAVMYLEGKTGSLVAGCALKEFRRRGVQAALIERRVADATAHGIELLASEAAEDIPEKPNPSLHNLLRLGFREAYKRENYQRR